jgi:hypothetical protein
MERKSPGMHTPASRGFLCEKQAARLAANCMARKNYVILQQEHKQIAKYG